MSAPPEVLGALNLSLSLLIELYYPFSRERGEFADKHLRSKVFQRELIFYNSVLLIEAISKLHSNQSLFFWNWPMFFCQMFQIRVGFSAILISWLVTSCRFLHVPHLVMDYGELKFCQRILSPILERTCGQLTYFQYIKLQRVLKRLDWISELRCQFLVQHSIEEWMRAKDNTKVL